MYCEIYLLLRLHVFLFIFFGKLFKCLSKANKNISGMESIFLKVTKYIKIPPIFQAAFALRLIVCSRACPTCFAVHVYLKQYGNRFIATK